MRVLIACEFSGVVRDAFIARGHDAVSCDLLPTERPGPHIEGDVLPHLADGWDLMIAHPPCTYLARSGARWWGRPGRDELTYAALKFVFALWDAPITKVALENPIGKLNQLWRRPDQIIEPWEFGHAFTKRTCLWLRGVPPLFATVIESSRPAFISSNTGARKRANGSKSQRGAAHNARTRSRTFPGIAAAMAEQWGSFPEEARCAQ